jgi:hypothetical protein
MYNRIAATLHFKLNDFVESFINAELKLLFVLVFYRSGSATGEQDGVNK